MGIVSTGGGGKFTAEHLEIRTDKADDSVAIWSNTTAAGGGTALQPLVDAAGHFQIDILSQIPGVGATNLGKAEDAVHASGDTGVAIWGVRNDTLASLVDTDGDYAPFQMDASGGLFTATSAQADLETTHQNAVSATATGTVASIDGYTMAMVHCTATAAWDRTGTYTIQASPDGGTTYKNIDIWDVENGRAIAGAAITISASDNRTFLIDLRGMDKLRVNVSVSVAGTAGTFTAKSRALPITNSVLHDMAQGSDGAAIPPGLLLVGGSDGTNLEAIQVTIDNATASATPNVLIGGGIYKSALDAYGDNDASPFHMSVGGELLIGQLTHDNLNLNATLQMADVDVTAAAPLQIQIGDGTTQAAVIATILSLKTDFSSIAGVVTSVGAGTVGTGVQRVTLGSNDPAVTALELLDNAVYVDDADWADTTSSHILVGGLYQSVPQSITDGDVGPFQVDVNGNIIESSAAAIKTAVEIMDDWDETNRAAVNLISAQVGVVGGTGVDAANVLRVSLATNIPLPAGTNAIGKLAANSGVDIGDVDILSLPAGNLGMQLMAASLSMVPASNITDATYIGDIKFGESLPAGTAAIGKLAANSGVDIGDVDVTSITLPTGTATVSAQASVSGTYAAVTGSDLTTDMEGLFSYIIQETEGLTSVICRVQFSNDNTNWVADSQDLTIAASGSGTLAGTSFYQYVRMQFKTSAAPTSVTINAQGYGK